MNKRLKRELVALFGRNRVEQAEALVGADVALIPELPPLDLDLPDLDKILKLAPVDAALFVGELIVTAPASEAVQAAADALLKHTGQPDKQRALVAALNDATALLLCLWLMDTDFAGRLYDSAA